MKTVVTLKKRNSKGQKVNLTLKSTTRTKAANPNRTA